MKPLITIAYSWHDYSQCIYSLSAFRRPGLLSCSPTELGAHFKEDRNITMRVKGSLPMYMPNSDDM